MIYAETEIKLKNGCTAVVRNARPENAKQMIEYLRTVLNCTPFVRQYDIMSNRWGDFNAKGYTKQTIHTGI